MVVIEACNEVNTLQSAVAEVLIRMRDRNSNKTSEILEYHVFDSGLK